MRIMSLRFCVVLLFLASIVRACPPYTQPLGTPQLELQFVTSNGHPGPGSTVLNVSHLIASFYNNDSVARTAFFFPKLSGVGSDRVQIRCTAHYPIEMEVDSEMAVRVQNLKHTRSVGNYSDPCSYRYEIRFQLVLHYSVTANYVCQDIVKGASASSSLSLFVNDGSRPTLLNAPLGLNFLEVDGVPDDLGLIRIPCVSTDPYVEPQLFKENLLLQELQNTTKTQDYVHFISGQGFFISARKNVPIAYSCALEGTKQSLKIRLRDLAPNTGSGIPTHYRTGPNPSDGQGRTIFNPNETQSLKLVCESNKPINFRWTLQDSKLKFNVRQEQVEDGTYYKHKATLEIVGRISLAFTVHCQLNETGNAVLHSWRYQVSMGTTVRPGITYTIDSGKPHFQCVSSAPKTPFIALITCANQVNCKTARRFSHLINTKSGFYPFEVSTGYPCYKPPKDAAGRCAIIPLVFGKNEGLIVCREEPITQNSEIRPVYHDQNYYTGLENSIITELNQDTPNQTLRLRYATTSPTNSRTLYVDENVTFVCEASKFLFSEGVHFFVHFTNGSTLPSTEYEQSAGVTEWSQEGIVTAQLTIPIKSLHISRMECSAPHVTTHKWSNISINMTITQGEQIHFIPNKDPVTIGLKASDRNRSLSCEAWGEPRPTLEWTKDGQSNLADRADIILHEEQRLEDRRGGHGGGTRVVLQFTEIKESHNGIYVCSASNRKSVDSKRFVVTVEKPEFWLYVGIVCVAIVIIIGSICCFYMRKQQRMKLADVTEKLTELENEFLHGNQDMEQKYTDLHENARYLPYKQDFEIPSSKLEVRNDELLGSGMSGLVLKGFLTKQESRIPVAIKTTRSSEIGELKLLLSEIKILMYIGKHSNVINLIGARTSELRQGKLCAVVEFCKFGSLQSFIRDHRSGFVDQIDENGEINVDKVAERQSQLQVPPRRSKAGVSWRIDDILVNLSEGMGISPRNSRRLSATPPTVVTTTDLVRWSLQIANGMEYLGQKNVIHGDLALRNILLAEDMVVKITDFGLSRHLHDYEIYYKKRKDDLLPWRWLAIEAIGDCRFSIETDIWAYGVTLWEIFSLAETPYQGSSWGEEFVNKLASGYRLPNAKYSTDKIYDMMKRCWTKKPAQRPSFTMLRNEFDSLLTSDPQQHEYESIN